MTELRALREALAGRYDLEREIGAGGMATVWLASDVRHGRKVALKLLHPELSAVLGTERFLKEIALTASLQHPHILPLFDSGEAAGQLFYVMPFVEGETLRTRLEREGQLPIEDALRTCSEVADALQYAHERGVIHRDIKPENILLQGGHAVVADFGIALAVQQAGGQRMTQTGLSLGTPQYMSPEQAMGERTIDGRSDVYALGAVTYEMLTGAPPFTGANLQAIVARVLSAEPEPVTLVRKTVPVHVEAAVLKALAKLPADRFARATEFAAACRGTGSVEPLSVAAGGRGAAASGGGWRLAVGVGVAALVAGVAIGALALGNRGGATAAAIPRPKRITHTGGVGCAAIAPNGEEYAAIVGEFSEESGCVGDLVVRTLPAGSDQRRIPNVKGVLAIEWSADGRWLLLGGSVNDTAGLRLFNRETGAVRLLRSGQESQYGFVDARTVYVAGDNVIRKLDLESGEVRDSIVLAPDLSVTFATWSPDGQRILIRGMRLTRVRTWLADARGRLLDSLVVPTWRNVWLSDHRVALNERENLLGGDIIALSLDGAREHFIREPRTVIWPSIRDASGPLSVTTTGARMMAVVNQMTDDQVVFDLRGGNRSHLTVRSLGSYLGDPRFSPDGRRIAYGREDALGFNVYVVHVDSGGERAVTSDTIAITRTSWTNNDQVLGTTSKNERLLADVGSGRLRRLGEAPSDRYLFATRGNRWYSLSVTGRDISIADSLGKEIRTFALPRFPVLGARASETGDSIFVHVRTAKGMSILVVSATGDSLAMSPPFADEGLTMVQPMMSSTLYFSRYSGATELWRLPSMTSRPELLTRLPAHCYAGSVAVSPDGSHAVCNVTTYRPDAWVVEVPGGK